MFDDEQQAKRAVILGLLPELGASLTSKSQAEYLYTGSAIAGFGAVSWGVGALRDGIAPHWLVHPTIIACLGVLAVAAAVVIKIIHDHRLYIENQKIIVDLREALVSSLENPAWLPAELLKREQETKFPSGYFVSIIVVILAAAGACAFCLSMFVYAKDNPPTPSSRPNSTPEIRSLE